jgi:hypothetical protein
MTRKRKSLDMETSYGVAPEESDTSLANEASAPKENLLTEIESLKAQGLTKTQEFKTKMRELEGVLGISQINPFGTNELDIFEDQISEMTNSDLQKLAIRVGINPNYDRSTLKKVLTKEFIASNRNSRRNIMPSAGETIQLDPTHPKYEEARKILGEF